MGVRNGRFPRIRTSNGNRVEQSSVVQNLQDGIELSESSDNVVSGDSAKGNQIGIDVVLGQSNEIAGSSMLDNSSFGVILNSSIGNSVHDNSAMRNGVGYVVYLSDQNSLTGNNAASNSNDGVEVVDASSNRLSRNTSNSNGRDGFAVFGTSELNTLDQNTACHNTTFDAEDSSTGAGNTWLNNLFCTTSGI